MSANFFFISVGLRYIYIAGNFDGSEQPFTTFAIHKRLNDTGENVVKMFSSKPMSDELLDQLFHSRSWTVRKEWQAFPKLYPVVSSEKEEGWPSIILDGFKEDEQENGILYVNAFESCISVCRLERIFCVLFSLDLKGGKDKMIIYSLST